MLRRRLWLWEVSFGRITRHSEKADAEHPEREREREACLRPLTATQGELSYTQRVVAFFGRRSAIGPRKSATRQFAESTLATYVTASANIPKCSFTI